MNEALAIACVIAVGIVASVMICEGCFSDD